MKNLMNATSTKDLSKEICSDTDHFLLAEIYTQLSLQIDFIKNNNTRQGKERRKRYWTHVGSFCTIEWCFKPHFCTFKAILGRGQSGLTCWPAVQCINIVPQMSPLIEQYFLTQMFWITRSINKCSSRAHLKSKLRN